MYQIMVLLVWSWLIMNFPCAIVISGSIFPFFRHIATLKILKGNLGKHSMMIMAVKQMISIHIISDPSFQWCVSWSSKGCNWDKPMTMARPLQKPSITGEGNRVMKRESLVTETSTIKRPANMTEGKSNSTPSPLLPVPARWVCWDWAKQNEWLFSDFTAFEGWNQCWNNPWHPTAENKSTESTSNWTFFFFRTFWSSWPNKHVIQLMIQLIQHH